MARSEVTLGFVGSGKVEKRNAYALLNDFIEANGGNAKFIFPLTSSFWNPALEVVADFARDNDIPVEAVVDDSTAKTRSLKTLLAGARRQHSSAAVAHKMASLLEEARKGYLIVCWDDEDEAAMAAVKEADAVGVGLLELTRGLDRIELVSEDGEDEDEPISDEVPEPETVEDVAADQDEEDDQEGTTSEEDENDDDGDVDDDADVEAEEEFEEAEAEDDLDTSEMEDQEAEAAELPQEDEEDVELPDVDDEEPEPVTAGMTEFQSRLIVAFEKFTDAIAQAVKVAMEEPGPVPKPAPARAAAKKAPAAKPAPAAKKTAPPAKAPAKKAAPKPAEKPAVKRTVPAKKAPAKAEPATNGKMSRAQAQKIIDGYRPRRGRPPADVTEARKVLGLA